MNIKENARLAVYNLVAAYHDEINGDFFGTLTAIKAAYTIGAINRAEVELLANAMHSTPDEILTQ